MYIYTLELPQQILDSIRFPDNLKLYVCQLVYEQRE